ncbi:MAG: NAD(P)/FAD-dependent oxidoreductase [Anaerovoracaceae bacterium]
MGKTDEPVYDLLVIGGGPAGYTAAIYGARGGLSVLVLEQLSAGGQMTRTSQVDNYPGFPEGADGFLLGEAMRKQAERFGARTKLAEVRALDLTGPLKTAETSSGRFYGRALIFAAGAVPRKLDLDGEEALTGRGVHYCVACDGMTYRDQTVMVVGGGNSAVEDALHLSRLAKKVILVHRRGALRAEKIMQDALRAVSNVEYVWNSTVTALHAGDSGKLTHVTLQNLSSGIFSDVQVHGLFVSIGRQPASELVRGQLDLDPAGYVIADETTRSSVPGVFAAGDVRTKPLRQIVTATADGAAAAYFAQSYLA